MEIGVKQGGKKELTKRASIKASPQVMQQMASDNYQIPNNSFSSNPPNVTPKKPQKSTDIKIMRSSIMQQNAKQIYPDPATTIHTPLDTGDYA